MWTETLPSNALKWSSQSGNQFTLDPFAKKFDFVPELGTWTPGETQNLTVKQRRKQLIAQALSVADSSTWQFLVGNEKLGPILDVKWGGLVEAVILAISGFRSDDDDPSARRQLHPEVTGLVHGLLEYAHDQRLQEMNSCASSDTTAAAGEQLEGYDGLLTTPWNDIVLTMIAGGCLGIVLMILYVNVEAYVFGGEHPTVRTASANASVVASGTNDGSIPDLPRMPPRRSARAWRQIPVSFYDSSPTPIAADQAIMASTLRELEEARAKLSETRARAESAERAVANSKLREKKTSLAGLPDGIEALAHLSAIELRVLEHDLRGNADQVARAADARQAAEDAERTLCVVCLDAPRTHCATPCGHRCVCAACAQQVSAQCPVCRAVVRPGGWVAVYD